MSKKANEKWLLTADLQWSQQQRLSDPAMSEGTVTSRLRDMLNCWEWIVEQAIQDGCSRIVVAGDVYDDRVSLDLPEIYHTRQAVEKASAQGLRVTLLVGNHDSYLRNPSVHSLGALRGCADVVDTPVVETVNNVRVGFVPWYDDERQLCDAVDQVAGEGADILISHFLLAECVPAGVGIRYEDLALDRFRKVYMGDIHAPVTYENVVYVGSPMQLNYSDAGGKRGVLTGLVGRPMQRIWNEVSPKFHVVRSVDSVSTAVGFGDFVRVDLDEGEDTGAVVETIREMCPQRVEVVGNASVKSVPRMDVKVTEPHRDILRKYVRMHNGDLDEEAVSGLVGVGMDFIQATGDDDCD